MNIGTICSRRIVSAPVGAPVSDVVALMHAERVGMVIITRALAEGPVVVGVITDRDILRAQLARVADFSAMSPAEVMTRDPLLVHADDDSGEVLQRLRARGVRRAAVVDSRGLLVGLVSVDDLLPQIAREVTALAAVVARQARPLVGTS